MSRKTISSVLNSVAFKGKRTQISLQVGERPLPVPSWQSMEIALLKEMEANGGSIDTEKAVKNLIRYFPQLTENELAVLNRSGETRWANRVRWARQALVGKNQLDSSTHGIWRITASGRDRLKTIDSSWKPTYVSEETSGDLPVEQSEFLMLRTQAESRWEDEIREGGRYHYGTNVPNNQRIRVGSLVLFDRTSGGKHFIIGKGKINEIAELGPGTSASGQSTIEKSATISEYEAFQPPLLVSEQIEALIKSNSSYNSRYAIKPITREAYERILEFSNPETPTVSSGPKFTMQSLVDATFLEEGFLEDIVGLLQDKKQLILYGPPGTGKTFVAKELARYLVRNGGSYTLVQFHPSFSYEDFVEGIRPRPFGSGIDYPIVDGALKEIAGEATANGQGNTYVLIIDEINRGALARIFGEVIYCLEYRGESVQLAYSQKSFSLPPNLMIIGTMNSADRSIALVDYALRRRFAFIEFPPDKKVLSKWLDANPPGIDKQKILDFFEEVNSRISQSETLGKHFQIGHSYFMEREMNKQKLDRLWRFRVLPLVSEYFFDEPDELDAFQTLYQDKFS